MINQNLYIDTKYCIDRREARSWIGACVARCTRDGARCTNWEEARCFCRGQRKPGFSWYSVAFFSSSFSASSSSSSFPFTGICHARAARFPLESWPDNDRDRFTWRPQSSFEGITVITVIESGFDLALPVPQLDKMLKFGNFLRKKKV